LPQLGQVSNLKLQEGWRKAWQQGYCGLAMLVPAEQEDKKLWRVCCDFFMHKLFCFAVPDSFNTLVKK
jgi:hypothetical protein